MKKLGILIVIVTLILVGCKTEVEEQEIKTSEVDLNVVSGEYDLTGKLVIPNNNLVNV